MSILRLKMFLSRAIAFFFLQQIWFSGQADACGGNVRENRVISSPGYPGDYGNGENCEWNIRKDGNYQIRISFTFFKTEKDHDFVKVYRFSDDDSISNIFSGELAPFFLTSTGNSMRVMFTSNSNQTRHGFTANISFVPVLETPSTLRPDIITVPSGVQRRIYIRKNREIIFSHQFVLVSSDLSDLLTVNITRINLTSDSYVEVRDGSSRDNRLLGRYSGTHLPKPLLTSSAYVWISFHGNSINTEEVFEVKITAGWYPATISSSGQANLTVGSNVTISCVRNVTSQSRIELVNSENFTVDARLVTRWFQFNNTKMYIFHNIQINDTDTYRCRETVNGRVGYSNGSVALNVTDQRRYTRATTPKQMISESTQQPLNYNSTQSFSSTQRSWNFNATRSTRIYRTTRQPWRDTTQRNYNGSQRPYKISKYDTTQRPWKYTTRRPWKYTTRRPWRYETTRSYRQWNLNSRNNHLRFGSIVQTLGERFMKTVNTVYVLFTKNEKA